MSYQFNINFAIVVCDINDLKIVNETRGHISGDRYIKKACVTICNIFKHSPVFRVGGDEFAVICQDDDYEHLDVLSKKLDEINVKNKVNDDLVIAFGAAKYEFSHNKETVFELADQSMYKYKTNIKE